MTRNSPALSLLVALATLAPAVGHGSAADSAAAIKPPGIQGVWDSTVSLVACQSPSTVMLRFRALNLFDRHGSLIATSQVAPPPSLGKWEWLGGNRYRAMFRFQRFGAGGVFEGTTQVNRVITLAADGQSFTGVVTTQLFDLNDVQYGAGCGVEEARRVF